MSRVVLSGGDKLKAALAALSKKVGKGATLNVGFLAGSFENDGTSTAYVALCNDRGGTIPERTVAAHKATIYKRVGKNGQIINKGRFTTGGDKRDQAFDVDVPEHVIPEHTVPARPFFRWMIRDNEGHWGSDLGERLKQSDYNVDASLSLMGEQMTNELRLSIRDQQYEPLAPSTVAKKKNDTTLIDSRDMLNAVTYEIEE